MIKMVQAVNLESQCSAAGVMFILDVSGRKCGPPGLSATLRLHPAPARDPP